MAVLRICVSKVSLEINPLHFIFNEGPKRERESERERERHKGEEGGGSANTTVLALGVKASVFIGSGYPVNAAG